MAQSTKRIQANFEEFMAYFDREMINASISTTLEESVDYNESNHRIAIRAFERYSYIGSNRLSLHVTVIEEDENTLFISAISTGGSQAVFFKINTWGESSFLESYQKILDNYLQKKGTSSK